MVEENGSSSSGAKEFYEDEKQLMKLCDFLRSSEGPPVREAIEMDKRVYYIKGALMEGLSYNISFMMCIYRIIFLL